MNVSRLPVIDNNVEYSKYERLMFALGHYYAELEKYNQDPQNPENPKPIVLKISKQYAVSESTLRRHIKTPGQRTHAVFHAEQQVLTPAEEAILVERVLFLDDSNVPADRNLLYDLAHKLLHRRDPTKALGRNWIYSFLGRHPECKYVLTKTISTSRANAYSWDVMDDFFWKVCYLNNKYSVLVTSIYIVYSLNVQQKSIKLDLGIHII